MSNFPSVEVRCPSCGSFSNQREYPHPDSRRICLSCKHEWYEKQQSQIDSLHSRLAECERERDFAKEQVLAKDEEIETLHAALRGSGLACTALKDSIKIITRHRDSLKQALEEIRDHEHCKSEYYWSDKYLMEHASHTGPDEPMPLTYRSGIMDGHRCCAALASKALKGEK